MDFSTVNISYLVNQYPKVSHSFIRREIIALEKLGINVQRIAQRGWQDTLADSQDFNEREKTQYIVKQGIFSMLIAALKEFLIKPFVFVNTFYLAFKMREGSDTTLIYHLVYFLEACQMQTWLKQHNSKHIHAHFGTNSAEIAMYASQLSGIPYSFTVHGPEEFDKPIALGLKQKIKLSKFVAAISSFGRSQLFRWADYTDWPKIKEVHCGLEKDFYSNYNLIKPNKNTIVCVGRICEQKGQLLLIEAIKKLHDTGVIIDLVLAGDGEMRQAIESLIRNYGLKDHISITGWVSSSEVRDIILASDFMVLPSFAEGLPVVIMEAMSLKRLVISTYVAGIPELIKHQKNGWLCPAGDVDALAEVMREALFTSKSKLQTMADLAFDSVTEKHNIDTEALKLAKYIKA
jgi:colanic acid/amylovoran biosynthesis glycosyltransferase